MNKMFKSFKYSSTIFFAILLISSTFCFDPVAEIKAQRIPSGPYAGGYLIAPNGHLNWYFTNLGLLPIVQFLSGTELDLHVRQYLDLYLAKMNQTDYTISDVLFPNVAAGDYASYRLQRSDSDDSYAATFLTLAARYMRASGNTAWWTANKFKLSEIAYNNLARSMKSSNGLLTVYQQSTCTNCIGYLMDNCENYRGLRDFASTLRNHAVYSDQQTADYYDSVASTVASGIAKLFNATAGAFAPSDADGQQPKTNFYPGTTCQVFPQAFGIGELATRFDPAWAYLNTYTPNWQDGHYDPYPWSLLGFVAAKRGNMGQAQAQLTAIDSLFANNRAMVTINELGWYLRTKNILKGMPDV